MQLQNQQWLAVTTYKAPTKDGRKHKCKITFISCTPRPSHIPSLYSITYQNSTSSQTESHSLLKFHTVTLICPHFMQSQTQSHWSQPFVYQAHCVQAPDPRLVSGLHNETQDTMHTRPIAFRPQTQG